MTAMTVILRSVVTCPHCGGRTEETMPIDACRYFYECQHCAVIVKPRSGDCCIFCSYGSVPCPPQQEEKKCC